MKGIYMKNIGIITINDNNNYGNRLQAYAAQEGVKNINSATGHIYNNILKNNKLSIFSKEYIKYYL